MTKTHGSDESGRGLPQSKTLACGAMGLKSRDKS
jgi:hypothetical protein